MREEGEVVSRVFGLAVIKATNIKKLHAGGRRSCLANTHTHMHTHTGKVKAAGE